MVVGIVKHTDNEPSWLLNAAPCQAIINKKVEYANRYF